MRVFSFSYAWVMAAVMVLTALIGGAEAAKYKPKAGEDWITYKNSRFGYRLFYPSAVFAAGQSDKNGSGLTFTTEDGKAKVVVFGVDNGEKLSPTDYRRVLLEDFGGYDKLDYSPKGRSWFVLSGFRGDNIYYQKIMFSCRNKIINVFSMTFPTKEKPYYERMIEIMEDHFRPGRGKDAPQGC